MKTGRSPVGNLDDSVYVMGNSMIVDKFRMLELGPIKPIDFEHFSDKHDDYVDLEQDKKYNSPKTVPENSSRGVTDGASTEWFPVPKLPALKEEPLQLHFMTSMPPRVFTEAKYQL